MEGGTRLRLMGREPERGLPLGDPCCVYGLVTREALENLIDDVAELRSRINTLLWGFGGAVLLDVLMRLAGR